MIRPEDTNIAAAHTRNVLAQIEQEIDDQLKSTTTLVTYIEATKLIFRDDLGRNIGSIDKIEHGLLLAVAQRYAPHWHVTIRPHECPTAWFRFAAFNTFRDQITIQLHREQSVYSAGLATPPALQPTLASQTDIDHLQHDARVLLELAAQAQRAGRKTKSHKQAVAAIATLLKTLPGGRLLPEGKLPTP